MADVAPRMGPLRRGPWSQPPLQRMDQLPGWGQLGAEYRDAVAGIGHGTHHGSGKPDRELQPSAMAVVPPVRLGDVLGASSLDGFHAGGFHRRTGLRILRVYVRPGLRPRDARLRSAPSFVLLPTPQAIG